MKGNSLYRNSKLPFTLRLDWATVTLWCCSYNMALLLMPPPRTTTRPFTLLPRRARKRWPVCCWSMVHPSLPPPRRASHLFTWQPSMETWRLLACYSRKMRRLMLKERTASLPCTWLPIMTTRWVCCPAVNFSSSIIIVVKNYYDLFYSLFDEGILKDWGKRIWLYIYFFI